MQLFEEDAFAPRFSTGGSYDSWHLMVVVTLFLFLDVVLVLVVFGCSC